ncbi:MAG TPA: YitT family protein [Spirochaetota bacterium]|nr:YitT family protein [Spirochaetota bacterium]HPS86686.1 YitT family protein [Spirochaetota bacterium]
MKKHLVDFFYNTFLLTLGSAICAVPVNAFLIPHEFLSSGITGVSLIIYYKFHVLPVGLLYLLINIPVFFLGWLLVGLRFVFYTIWGMTLYSIMLYLLNFQIVISDKMLAAVIAGALTGLGVAIMLRSYGSGGGSEILCVIMNKFFSLTVGTGAIIINSIILLVSATLFPIENVLYTFVFMAVSTRVTDMVFHGLTRRKAVLIISDEWKEIVHVLTNIHKKGVTLINGQGGYNGDDKTILYSVLNRNDVPALKRIVTEIDPRAFITIMGASDVVGVDVGNQPHW